VNCLDDERVEKVRLTVDAIDCPYDSTRQQPRLFVTKSCRHLSQVLEEFGRQMCVNLGGAASVEKAIAAQSVNTAVTNAGVEISGRFQRVIKDAVGNATYLQSAGPTQLAYQGSELEGHGIAHHAEGFGSPVGRLQAMERCLSTYTIDELKSQGIATGRRVCLEFLSGITVAGVLIAILRRDQKNLVFTLEQCTVTGRDREVLFDPDWGVYDMAVGDSIVSVYGGSADQQRFPMYPAPSAQATVATQVDAKTLACFALYEEVRRQRESAGADNTALAGLLREILVQGADEWLLLFEGVELARQYGLAQADYAALLDRLRGLGDDDEDEQRTCLINYGLQRLDL